MCVVRGHGWRTENREDDAGERGITGEGRKGRAGRLFCFELRPASSTTHDRAHKSEETVRVFGRRHGADLVLHVEIDKFVYKQSKHDETRTLSADMPFHRCSTLFTTPYGVNISMIPR